MDTYLFNHETLKDGVPVGGDEVDHEAVDVFVTTGHLSFEQALDLALLSTVGSPSSHPTLAAQCGAGRVQDEVASASVVSRLGRRRVGQQGKLLQDFDADDVVAEYRVAERVLKRCFLKHLLYENVRAV